MPASTRASRRAPRARSLRLDRDSGLGPRASGRFVVIEGPEGAGKSTLVRWLAGQVRADGQRVVTVREPGGTPIAEAARKLALKSRHDRAFGAELFLFLAARADLVERVIRPALADGQIVIADRFGLSTIAYQVAGRGLSREDVEAALRVATGGLTPDLTLILDVPVTVGRERQKVAGKGRSEEHTSELQSQSNLVCRLLLEKKKKK